MNGAITLDHSKEKIIVVGAGLSGATVANRLAEHGYTVDVYEQRSTLAGNAFDYVDENGIRIQKYGPHIFHTNRKEVFEYLSRFTGWVPYEHRVLGFIQGKYVPIPFNLTALGELYDPARAEELCKILLKETLWGNRIPVLHLKQHPDERVRRFADFVYENVFYHYTVKQWGFPPEELGEAVMNRVPVALSHEDRYFTDAYQFQPEQGYTALVENLLKHPDIHVKTNENALKQLCVRQNALYWNGTPYMGKVVFTGRIDDLFQRKYGALSYRSLRFEFETHDTPSYQPSAVVNYTTTEQFTRISEFTKFCCKPCNKTVIVKEYSKPCEEGDIPYYPIPVPKKQAEYERYRKDAERIPNLYLLGRLACYKYVNMDEAVACALAIADGIAKER